MKSDELQLTRKSSYDEKAKKVDAYLAKLRNGVEFCANDIANALSGGDYKIRQQFASFLTGDNSGYLMRLAKEGKLVFVGWQDSEGRIKKKVFRKV